MDKRYQEDIAKTKIFIMGMKLDRWQEEVLATEGNVTIRAGRQVGKSTIIAIKVHDFASKYPGSRILCIAASQRQSGFIFEKIRELFDEDDETEMTPRILRFQRRKKRFQREIERKQLYAKYSVYKEAPTKTKIHLKNGTIIYSLPAGRTGAFIRGLTIDLLVAEEAAYIPEVVWNAVLPMIAVSRKTRRLGWLLLLSTPFGKGGFFYDTHFRDDFRKFHVSSENCPRIGKDFLDKEKRRMSKQEYAQEYLGEFIDEYNQLFATSLIKKCMTFLEWNTENDYNPRKRYYLGVDFARYGGDENAFVIAELDERDNIKIVKSMTTARVSLTDTIGRIKILDEKFNFRRIFVDDGGLGAGPTDVLIQDLGRKVVGINNAKRSIDREGRRKAIMKEDLYSNALMLMEAGKIEIISDMLLLKSLKSITYEYTADKNIRIAGAYSHLAEAFVRACWSIKEKGLRVYIA